MSLFKGERDSFVDSMDTGTSSSCEDFKIYYITPQVSVTSFSNEGRPGPTTDPFQETFQTNSISADSAAANKLKRIDPSIKFPISLEEVNRCMPQPLDLTKQVPKPRKRNRKMRTRCNFSIQETADLINLWATPEMQLKLKDNFGSSTISKVWEEISLQMQQLGHHRTGMQCKDHIQNVAYNYRRNPNPLVDNLDLPVSSDIIYPYNKILADILKKLEIINKNALEVSSSTPSNKTDDSPSQQYKTIVVGSSGYSARVTRVMPLQQKQNKQVQSGHPKVKVTPTGKSNNSANSSGINSIREVIGTEVHSRVKSNKVPSTSNSSPSTTNSQLIKFSGSSTATTTSHVNMEHDEAVTFDKESSLSQNGYKAAFSATDENTMFSGSEELTNPSSSNEYLSDTRAKRSNSTPLNHVQQPANLIFEASGSPPVVKKARDFSSAVPVPPNIQTNKTIDATISQYLSEMVNLERQRLELAKVRVENHHQMIMFMMQLLQTSVSLDQ